MAPQWGWKLWKQYLIATCKWRSTYPADCVASTEVGREGRQGAGGASRWAAHRRSRPSAQFRLLRRICARGPCRQTYTDRQKLCSGVRLIPCFFLLSRPPAHARLGLWSPLHFSTPIYSNDLNPYRLVRYGPLGVRG